jgi:coenzyme F420-0:L-glutamate ligase
MEVKISMRLYAVKIRLVKTGDNLAEVILEALKEQNLQLEDGDILALASKIVAYAEQRLIKLSEVKPSEKARKLAREFSLQPEFAELIIREADEIYGGVEKAVLTLKNGFLTANAGIDNKNTPPGFAVLWPNDARRWAKYFKEEIERRTGTKIAILIVDSGLIPLKIGTIGLALGVAGFKPIKDRRGEKDIYGKSVIITRHAIADDLASAAHLLMGEVAEQTPVVLIKEAPIDFDNDAVYGGTEMMIPFKECIFMGTFLANPHD